MKKLARLLASIVLWNPDHIDLISQKGGDKIFLHLLKTSNDPSLCADLMHAFMDVREGNYDLEMGLVRDGLFQACLNSIDFGVTRASAFDCIIATDDDGCSFLFFTSFY